jgi:hypothetical protein
VGTVTGEVQIFPPLTAIKAPPRKGAKVVVVIRKIGSNPIYSIENGHAGFFPRDKNGDQPCLFEVTGFDDPKVTETIDNLRKLRGKQRAEAEKAQAEKKVNGRQ